MSVVEADHPSLSAGRARGSSFYLAMRILAKPQREAMYDIYAFCRIVDDIADDGGARAPRKDALDEWRRALAALYAGSAPPPPLRDLATAVRAFDLRQEDFVAIIDGMAMDVDADVQAPDWATLELYCDRVASAVGRLSVRVFGTPAAEREGLAHHLGKALQLTNILRDIDEDAAMNRLYLPREALLAAGITSSEPARVAADPRLAEACAPVVARAQAHFDAAETIMQRCPRASVKPCRIMGAAYHAILRGVVARGFAAPRTRVRASKARFLLALMRYGLV